MKKKTTLFLALIAVLTFGLVGTGAWFSSQVSSSGNSLSAATLHLTVNDNGEGVVQTYSLSGLKPGDWALASGQSVLKNTGSIPGHLWFEIVAVHPADGALGSLVYPKFQANVAPWTRFGGDRVINASVGQRVEVADLNPGDSLPIVLYVSWPSSVNDNAAQGGNLTFDVVWHLDQIH